MRLFRLRFAITPWLALIGAAFILRALIPTGWMPTHTVDGFAIELCADVSTPGDPEQVRTAGEVFHAALTGAKPNKDDGKTAGDQPCSFAGLPQIAPPQTWQPPMPASFPQEIRPAALVAAIGRGLPAPPPPSTGPPHTA